MIKEKKCGTCKKIKSTYDFNFKCKKINRRQSYCKECQKIYRKEHYEKNKKELTYKICKRRFDIKNKLNLYKESKKCVDCKKKYPSYIMDFDHLSDKKSSISDMVTNGYSWESIICEIKKCEIVCSNCHRERTYKRLNNHL